MVRRYKSQNHKTSPYQIYQISPTEFNMLIPILWGHYYMTLRYREDCSSQCKSFARSVQQYSTGTISNNFNLYNCISYNCKSYTFCNFNLHSLTTHLIWTHLIFQLNNIIKIVIVIQLKIYKIMILVIISFYKSYSNVGLI